MYDLLRAHLIPSVFLCDKASYMPILQVKILRLPLSPAQSLLHMPLNCANGISAWLLNCPVSRNSSLFCSKGPTKKGQGFDNLRGGGQREASIFLAAGVIAFSCKHRSLWDSKEGTPCTTWVYIYALTRSTV